MKNDNRKERFVLAKGIFTFVTGALVELFVGAATRSIVDNVDAPKIVKTGVKAGGYLVGLAAADKISEHMWNGVEELIGDVDDLREALKNGEDVCDDIHELYESTNKNGGEA